MRLSDRHLKTVAFFAALSAYVAVGYWLQVGQGFIVGDSLARVAAAQSVLHSRHPHLSAIGFIFTPLTAMVQVPIVMASPLWPALTERAFAGTLTSAPFMAGAVVQTMSLCMDRGLPRPFTVVTTAIFALNPMIVFYGSNGMSEAPFVFFSMWAVRRLIMWLADDDVHHLIAAGGIAMALSYLTRYDSVAYVAVAGLLVAVTTYLRARSAPRLQRAVLDLLLVSLPGLAAFLGWAVASWLITGDAFAQFTSEYGNAAILQQSGHTAAGLSDGLLFSSACVALLAPTLLPLAVLAVGNRWQRLDWQPLIVPVALYGSVLFFQTMSYISGSTFPFLRFYIAAIPMATCLAVLAAPDGALKPAKRRGRFAPQPSPASLRTAKPWRYVAAATLLALSLPITAWGMGQPRYAPQEYALGAVLVPDPYDVTDRKATESRIAATFSTERKLAAYLDGLDLPDGSVVADTVYGFAVVAASRKPKTFVIPSDRDFVALLNDPEAGRVEYLLTVPNTGRGVSDAVNQRYPTLYETGAGVATLALEIPNDGHNQPKWRLYRVNDFADQT